MTFVTLEYAKVQKLYRHIPTDILKKYIILENERHKRHSLEGGGVAMVVANVIVTSKTSYHFHFPVAGSAFHALNVGSVVEWRHDVFSGFAFPNSGDTVLL